MFMNIFCWFTHRKGKPWRETILVQLVASGYENPSIIPSHSYRDLDLQPLLVCIIIFLVFIPYGFLQSLSLGKC
jgi:hypothetical protein